MSSEQARMLLERGIQAARAGQKEQARKLIQQALRLDQYSDAAWLYLASVARNKRERLMALKRTLEINPRNEMALQAVKAMGIDPAQLVPQARTIGESLAEADTVVQKGDVPLPSAEDTEESRQLAEQIAQQYLVSRAASHQINWEKKNKRRAGEREITILRLQIAAAAAAFLFAVFGVLAVVVSNNPAAQRILFGASETPIPPTRTPIPSFTPTIGITPTPSPTRDTTAEPTLTFTPTVDPFILPRPRELSPQPTDIEFLVQGADSFVLDAVRLLEENNLEEVVPLMERSRFRQGTNFNPNPFYYEALAYAEQGQFNEALAILTEAEETIASGVRINPVTAQALIDLGFAQVRLIQAEDALERGNPDGAETLAQQALERAEASYEFTKDFPEVHLTIAKAHFIQDNYDEAFDTLVEGRELDGNEEDMNLILGLADLYIQRAQQLQAQGDEAGAQEMYARAGYQAFLALYITPYIEEAHRIQIEVALAQQSNGLAVIRSQEYLNFFPDDTDGHRFLGEARVAEGNTDLALLAYEQALEGNGTDAQMAEVYEARADLFNDQGRYQLALDDLSSAYELVPGDSLLLKRMRAAYAAGDYEIALTDAEALADSQVVSNGELELLEARIMVDRAEDDADYEQALDLLAQVGTNLSEADIAIADEYRARAQLGAGDNQAALTAIQNAIVREETGSRRFLRAQINKNLGNFGPAITDYEWVLTWAPVYDYPFAPSARAGLVEIHETIAEMNRQATATAMTATAAVEQGTATAAAERTEGAQTATAVFFATRSPTPTRTRTATQTPTVTRTPARTNIPEPEPTEQEDG